MESTVSEEIKERRAKPQISPSEGFMMNTNTSRHDLATRGNGSVPNFIGRHRMTAAIAQLNQQIQIIQEELDQLETLGQSSIVCRELISSVESSTDALLPMTKGPADSGWDRWFQGAHHASRNRKRWI